MERWLAVRLGLGCVFVLLSAACEQAPGGGPAPSAGQAPAAATLPAAGGAPQQPAGHQRMLALLAEVGKQAEQDNPFLGRALIDRARADLAAISQNEVAKRWFLNMYLGKHELRLGNNEAGVAHYLEANRLIEETADAPLDKWVQTLFETAVAYLRLGETQNCVARHTSDSCIFPIEGQGVHVDQRGSSAAIEYLGRTLAATPSTDLNHVRARWLLNIAYMTVGRYPSGVPAEYLIPPEKFDSDEEFPRFLDIAPKLKLNSFDLAGGAIAEDFNGDGWLDLLTSSMHTAQPLHFFVNLGNGRFAERTAEAGLAGLFGGLNLIQADYDGDGDVDVLVLRGGWMGRYGRHPNSLLRNNGNGTFTDVTFEAGLGEVHYPTQTGAWADYDGDGDLDLYVGNENGKTIRFDDSPQPEWQAPAQLFRNNGDGTFTDVAAQAGVENLRYAKGVVWGDYDGDRDPDIYVSNGGNPNRLYRNNGDGTFTDVAEERGVALPISSFATWFWDPNNDGALDLFVAAYGGPRFPVEVVSVAGRYLGLSFPHDLPRLYIGDGQGGFQDRAVDWGIAEATLPMGANFGDLDNDGFQDFYLGTGYPYYEGLVPNMMYRNRGGTGFADVTTAGGFGHLQKGHGVVFADLDHDGDQDVFGQMGGAYPGDAFGNVLFENPGFGKHWIKVKLVGVRSNRSGVGARIRAEVVEEGKPRSIYCWVGSGGSFGASPLRKEIGLGRAQRIELLEVYWPTSDETQRFVGVAADQLLEITEGRPDYRVLPHARATFGGP